MRPLRLAVLVILVGMFTGAAGGGARTSIDKQLSRGVLYIPHRGAALRYPEHTHLAYKNSTDLGFPWVEIDFAELSDSALGAFHDATVDRITTSSGSVGSFSSGTYLALTIDSDNWFGGGYGNLAPQLVEDVFYRFKNKLFVVDEKTGGGGTIVAELIAAGIPTTRAIVNAQNYTDLAPAVSAGYPASIAITPSGASDPADAISNGVTWGAVDHQRDPSLISDWVNAGINVVAFNVDRRYHRDAMLALGVKGFYSDDPEYLAADTPFSTTDNFAAQTWQPGMIAQNYKNSTLSTDDGLDAEYRGRFEAPDKWGFLTDSGTNLARAVLQGWAGPIKSDPDADDYTIDLKITFGTVVNGDQTRWAGVFVAADDQAYQNFAGNTDPGPSGYLFLMRKDGDIEIYTSENDQSDGVLLAADTSGAAISDGAEHRFKVVVSPSQLKIERLDGSGSVVQSVTSNDTTAGRRGGYFHLCHSRLPARFRDISIS